MAQQARLPLPIALSRITVDPARILGVDAGHLAQGAPARRLRSSTPDAWWTVEAQVLRSQGKNTPFLDSKCLGRVRYTLVAGQFVHEG